MVTIFRRDSDLPQHTVKPHISGRVWTYLFIKKDVLLGERKTSAKITNERHYPLEASDGG